MAGVGSALRLLPAGAVAGWGLHPLESAAFSRRTPTTDVPAVCQQGVKGSLRTMQYSQLLPFIWYNGGGEPIRPRLPRTLPSQRAVQATAIFPRGVSDGLIDSPAIRCSPIRGLSP